MRFLLVVMSLLLVACSPSEDTDASMAGEGEAELPATGTPAAGEELGAVDFRASCSADVAQEVDQAVAFLHHMMYQEARGLFEAIAEEEPGCATAHWGVAMTLFQPLWPARPGVEDRQRGWEAVQRARELEPGTERERALLRAAEAFFRDPGADEWWPRIERWAAALEEAYQERPDDLEITAFHGLGLLAAGQTADDRLAHNARAADVLQDVLERQPLHPGAIHYTIHADDARGRASEHLEVVDTYSEIAPSVPHALHMPSHIYVRRGDWPGVIEWNRRSADAALDHPAGERISLHHAHALDYMLYGHLQRADDGSAGEVLNELRSTGPYQDGFVSAFHLAIMPARYAVERRAWDEAAALEPRARAEVTWDDYAWPLALTWLARGVGAVETGDLAGAREAEARMTELGDRMEEAGEGEFATNIEMDRLILSGRIALAEGDEEAAVTRMEEAAALEGTVEKNPVTPGALLPPHEALGDLLLELDRPAEALVAYETSLEVWPRRYRTLLGAARAASAAGDEEKARDFYTTLLEVTVDDSDRPGVAEARAFVEGEA